MNTDFQNTTFLDLHPHRQHAQLVRQVNFWMGLGAVAAVLLALVALLVASI